MNKGDIMELVTLASIIAALLCVAAGVQSCTMEKDKFQAYSECLAHNTEQACLVILK